MRWAFGLEEVLLMEVTQDQPSHQSQKLGEVVEAGERAWGANWVVYPCFLITRQWWEQGPGRRRWPFSLLLGHGYRLAAGALGLVQRISRGRDSSPQREHSSWGQVGALRLANEKHLL